MTRKAVRKEYVLDVTWTDCPDDVKDQVRKLWITNDLGNDNYILIRTINDLIEESEDDGDETDVIVKYLREQGVGDDEQVWIHWWW